MVIVGGRTGEEDYSNTVSLYQINCNTWIQPGNSYTSNTNVNNVCVFVFFTYDLTFISVVSSVGEPVNRSVSLAMTGWAGRLFMSGGFNGVTLGRLLTLSLPSDPCVLLPTPEACNSSTGSCVWCRGTCASSDTAERYYRQEMSQDIKADIELHHILMCVCLFLFLRLGCTIGQSTCSPTPRSPDQCRRLKTCSECLARHPKTFSSPLQVRPSLQNKQYSLNV